MKRLGILLTTMVFVSMATVGAFAAPKPPPPPPPPAGPKAVTVPWKGSDLTAAHPVISGARTTLKGVAGPTAVAYEWTFGDNGTLGTGRLPIVDINVLEAQHTYTGATGTVYSATLTVYDNANASTRAYYKIQIVDNTVQSRTNMAIDAALWWVHTHLERYDYQGNPSWPCGRIENGAWNPGMVTDAFALQGFEQNGHFPSGNAATNPYVDDTKRLVNEITSHIFIKNVETKASGNRADTNSDGYMMGTLEDHVEYEPGIVLKALVNAGIGTQSPLFGNPELNFSGNAALAVNQFTWNDVIRNMIDYIAWAQLDTQPIEYPSESYWDANGEYVTDWFEPYKNTTVTDMSSISRGSWGYWAEGWGDPKSGARGGWGDIAMAFWMTTGLSAAKTQGFAVPAFVDSELNRFTDRANKIQNLDNTSDTNYGAVFFGPNNPNIEDPENPGTFFQANFFLVERAAELVSVLNYLGFTQGDERIAAALAFIDKNWNKHNYTIGQSHPRPYVDNWNGTEVTRSYTLDANITAYLKRADNPDADASLTGWNWAAPAPDYFGDGRSVRSNVSGGANYCFFHPYESDGTNITWGWEEGRWVSPSEGSVVWEKSKNGDDLNLFAFYALSQAMAPYAGTTFPSAASDSLGWEGRIMSLLTANQLSNGGFDEQNWVSGSPFGTPWALMTMVQKGNLKASIAMTTGFVSTTEHLYSKVTVVNEAGAAVPSASVNGTLTRGTTVLKGNWSVSTDPSGVANFDYAVNKKALAPGVYTFTVNSVSKNGQVWTQAPGSVTRTLTK